MVSSYVSSGTTNVVVTSEIVTATLVDSDTSINVVRPGKSTAVSTPLMVTWVCWDGMVISVEAAPSKVKNVSIELYDSSRVVDWKVNVVVNGKVVNSAAPPEEYSVPSMVAVMDTACSEATVPSGLVSVLAVCAAKIMVMSVGSAAVWVITPVSVAVVSAAGISTTEGVPEITVSSG